MHVNVVIVGHVDHGKSTLIGRLLYDSETLPEDKLAEIQILLEEYKKRFEFAYFLDSFEEELQEDRTIDTTRVLFKAKNYYTIVDVPGHKEFIKNMLTGASHARVAILVVSAPDGVQEQTKRHAFLLHMLGMEKILVAVNKMDLVDYTETAFQTVREQAETLLSSLGYSGVSYFPVSALEGDNVYKPSQRTEWYQGPTLIEALDAMEFEEEVEKPLRFTVQDNYDIDSEKVTVGRVESGTLRVGEELIFQPSGTTERLHGIKAFPEAAQEEATAGDAVGILTGTGIERGNVGGYVQVPPVRVDKFLGEVVVLEGSLTAGERIEIKCGTGKSGCLIKEIRESVDSETGEVIARNAPVINENEAATVVLETEPLVVEKFSEIPELGRFVIVRGKRNIGAGIVLETDI